MRALFLIPAEDAPRLEGPFSPEFKSFISDCLQKVALTAIAATLVLACHQPAIMGMLGWMYAAVWCIAQLDLLGISIPLSRRSCMPAIG